jgi:hypothetical protein
MRKLLPLKLSPELRAQVEARLDARLPSGADEAPPGVVAPEPALHRLLAHARDAARLSRRQFLGAAAAVAALAVATHARVSGAAFWPRTRFFTDVELATLEALCDRIIPPDHDPGARELGAPAYIERLLTSFDRGGAGLYLRGPYSGRLPFSDPWLGAPSARYPQNGFVLSMRPSRLQELYWRAELYGSAAAGLPAELETPQGGPLVGLREIYRQGLADVDTVSVSTTGLPFRQLGTAQQDAVLKKLDSPGVLSRDVRRGGTFVDRVIQHTLEGCFSAPEYGGNRRARGWRMIGLEGDSQPLGYSMFSLRDDRYHERPDQPMSTPNPDEIDANGNLAPKPLTPDGDAIQQAIFSFASIFEDIVEGSCA